MASVAQDRGHQAIPDRFEFQTLTLQDVARILQISRRSLSEMIRDGRVPRPLVVCRSYRWTVSTIEKWLESGGSETTVKGPVSKDALASKA